LLILASSGSFRRHQRRIVNAQAAHHAARRRLAYHGLML